MHLQLQKVHLQLGIDFIVFSEWKLLMKQYNDIFFSVLAEQGDPDYGEFYDRVQVWSLSSFKVSCQLLKNDLNRVSSVSLLMTSSTALANEGLFELTRRPSLTGTV